MQSDSQRFGYNHLHHRLFFIGLTLFPPRPAIAAESFFNVPLTLIALPEHLYFAITLAGIFSILVTSLLVTRARYKQAIRTLHEKEDLFRTMADDTYEWELWLDEDGSVIFTSPACERISGFPSTAFKSDRNLLDKIVHPDDMKQYERSLRQETREFHAFRIITRNGKTCWIEHLCRPIRDAHGNRLGRRSTIRDITDRKAAENRLRLAHQSIASSSNPVGMISMQGNITYANSAMLQLFGYMSTRGMNEKPFVDFLKNPETGEQILRNVKTEGQWQGGLLGKTHRGSVLELKIQICLIRDSSGNPLAMTAYFSDISSKKATEQEIRQIAYTDALTGLPNRLALKENLDRILIQASLSSKTVAVLMLDLDDFKQINDTTGHAKGDELIILMASRLRRQLDRNDYLARLGGDEFVLVLSDVQNPTAATQTAQHLLASLNENPFDLGVCQVFTSASIGIALFPENGRDSDTMLEYADMAMYEAKKNGRNTFRFFSDELHRRTIERHRLETGLRGALRNEEFFLVYQPQVNLRTGQVMAVEALVRWQHPEAGVLLPGMFIPVAEKTGPIHAMGEWILQNACRQIMQWRNMGLPPMRIAVNLSARQFKQPDLVDSIEKILFTSGLEPHYLELEITESVFMENLESAIETLVDLKTRGIQIAIDDFGTGYSSLNYLKNFPIDRLKIAQDFVRDIPEDKNNTTIIETIMVMAERLGLKVLAEGVETEQQMKFLRERGCCEMQGFYFARPMQAEQLEAYLRQQGTEQLVAEHSP
jgi:diguanylate cyclase (GGDEF)-like protein/PAS domain S-box-containing protein